MAGIGNGPMSGTPTIVNQILSRLSGDGTVSGLLPGGIYTRELKAPGTPGATPAAFDVDGDPIAAAVIKDGTDEGTAFGPDGSFDSFPFIYIYAPPHENGKATIANAWDAMFSALHKWKFATGNGTGAEVRVIGRLAILDDPDESTDRVMGGMRLQVTGLWRNTGA
jgi:hypothetical protein